MPRRAHWALFVIASTFGLTVCSSAIAQDGTATFVTTQQIDAALNRPEDIPAGTIAGLSEGLSYKVLVARRTAPALAEVHNTWTDIWYVIRGGGVVVTGGSLTDPVESPGGEVRGRAVSGGEEHSVKRGDLVTIPAGVPHWVRSINGTEIVYLVLKAASRPSAGASRVSFVSADQIQSAPHEIPGIDRSLMAATFEDTPGYSTGLARRTAPGTADVHRRWTDVWWVINGGGVVVTGGSLMNSKQTAAGELRGTGISGGEEHHVAAGDLVVIPAGVPHWVKAIDGPQIVYLDPKVVSANTAGSAGSNASQVAADGAKRQIGFLNERLIASPDASGESQAGRMIGNVLAPSPEMQKLFNVFSGTWSLRLEHADGTRGEGVEIWQPGPGGASLFEQEQDTYGDTKIVGFSATWWDGNAKGYRAIWCDNKLEGGCIAFSKLAQWEGADFVLRDQFERDGKKIDYKEAVSEITPTTYTQTIYQGEAGTGLKPILTVYATKLTEQLMQEPDSSGAEVELRALMAERRKASLEGDTAKIAASMTDDYLQTDIAGYRQDKATWLKEYFNPLADLIQANKFRWEEYQQSNLQFRFYGDCAVVTGELHLKGTGAKSGPQHSWVADPNATIGGTLHFTHVYVRRNGRWQLAALHNAVPFSPAAPSHEIDPAFRGFWILNVEKSDFGSRPKPKGGLVNWGEHGWTLAIVQGDGRLYADAVDTSNGCTFVGMGPSDLSCTVEVVTPRHVRLTMKQGEAIRRIGDIELLNDGTTQTTHHVTPSQGAPYVEKTIWEKQVP